MYGIQHASSASSQAHGGFWINRFYDGKVVQAEYLAVKLTQPLSQGQTYRISFKYARAAFPGYGLYSAEAQASVPSLTTSISNNRLNGQFSSIKRIEARLMSSSLWNTIRTPQLPNPSLSCYLDTDIPYEKGPGEGGVVNFRSLSYYKSDMWFIAQTYDQSFLLDNWDQCEYIFTIPTNTSDLEYLVIGYFDSNIPVTEIITRTPLSASEVGKRDADINTILNVQPGPNGEDISTRKFYFYIDDVSIVPSTVDCFCNYAVCVFQRNEQKESENPNKCCYNVKIDALNSACPVYGVKFFNVTKDQELGLSQLTTPLLPSKSITLSFCSDDLDDKDNVIRVSLLDQSGQTMCTYDQIVSCKCNCRTSFNKFGNDPVIDAKWEYLPPSHNGECCWKLSLKNQSYCDYDPNKLKVGIRNNNNNNGLYPFTITPAINWTNFANNQGSYDWFQFSNSLKGDRSWVEVAKLCIPPNNTGYDFGIKIGAGDTPWNCTLPYSFGDFEPKCVDQCCDFIETKLIKSEISQDCRFDIWVKIQNGTNSACKIKGVNIKLQNSNDLIYTNSFNQELPDNGQWLYIGNFEVCKCIGFQTNGLTFNLTVNLLDYSGSILCQSNKQVVCCGNGGPAMGKSLVIPEYSSERFVAANSISIVKIFDSGNGIFLDLNSQIAFDGNLSIFDVKGNLVRSQKAVFLKGDNRLKVDFDGLANGSYIVQVNNSVNESYSIFYQFLR